VPSQAGATPLRVPVYYTPAVQPLSRAGITSNLLFPEGPTFIKVETVDFQRGRYGVFSMFEGLKTRCSRHTPGTCTTCIGSWPVSCSPSPLLSDKYPAIKDCGCERLYYRQTGGASQECERRYSPQNAGHRFVRHLMRMLPCRPALQLMLMLPCRLGVHGWGLPPHRPGDATEILRQGALQAGRLYWAQPRLTFEDLVQVFLYSHLHSHRWPHLC
jgi:hypothetical protein